MKIKKFNIIAKNVIETEITSLRKLKQNLNISLPINPLPPKMNIVFFEISKLVKYVFIIYYMFSI